jgi:hypothetical protein
MLRTPSTEQSEHQTDVAAIDPGVSSQTVNNVNGVASADSTGPGIESDRSAASSNLAESNASSPLHSLATDAANRSPKSEPNTPEQTVPRLTELPVDLATSSRSDLKPKRPGGSVQQIAGTEETTNPDSQGAATIDVRPHGDDISEVGSPEPPAQPVAKPMNVRSRLDISIRSFRQTKPVPLRDVIRTIETMCRVRVDVSAVPPKLLAAEVTVSLRETTPLRILTEVGREHGLRAIVAENSVQLISNPN